MTEFRATIRLNILILIISSSTVSAQSCSVYYGGTSGVFTSPNYPKYYGTNKKCTYTITQSTSSSIMLTFQTFELDQSYGDNVTISCPLNSSVGSFTFYWRNDPPPISLPWCSQAQLEFVSDNAYRFQSRGFSVQYHVSTVGCRNTSFTAPSGEISWWNNLSNNDENCTFSIWTPSFSTFTFTFKNLSIEGTPGNCENEWLQITCSDTGFTLPTYCGYGLPTTATIYPCRQILLRFAMHSNPVGRGFTIHYSVSDVGCGRTEFAGNSGVVTSPNFPLNYTKNQGCQYYIYTVGSVILTFQAFDLDYPKEDDISITCYHMDSGLFTKIFRGDTLPNATYFPRCKRIYMSFVSNEVLTGSGFSLHYQVNPLVTDSSITLTPSSVSAYVGETIELTCSSTGTDYLPSWIFSKDGADESSVGIASFCEINFQVSEFYSAKRGEDGTHVCNLKIKITNLKQAGFYTCMDVGHARDSAYVAVVDGKAPNDITTDLLIAILFFTCVTFLVVVCSAIVYICKSLKGNKTEDVYVNQHEMHGTTNPANHYEAGCN